MPSKPATAPDYAGTGGAPVVGKIEAVARNRLSTMTLACFISIKDLKADGAHGGAKGDVIPAKAGMTAQTTVRMF